MKSCFSTIHPFGSGYMAPVLALIIGLSLAGKAIASSAPILSPASPYDYAFMKKGADPDLDAFYRGEVIAEEEMGDLRGGFNIAGMQMNFGAKINTLINDRINYETVLNFSDMGAKVVSQTLSDTMQEKFASMNQTMQDNNRWSQTPTSTNAAAGGQKKVFSTSGFSESNGTDSFNSDNLNNSGATLVGAHKAKTQVAEISQGKIDVSGLANFSGVVVNDSNGGTTAALHSITQKAIVTALANTASGQNIQQFIDIKISITKFSELKSAVQRANIMRSLSEF